MTRLITVSELKAHRRCRRLHRIKYVLGYRPAREAPALRFGTLVHAALEAWWDALYDAIARMRLEGSLGVPYHANLLSEHDAAAILAAALAALEVEQDRYEKARAKAMVHAYHGRWIGMDIEPLGVEVLINEGPELPGVPIVNPWTADVEPLFRQGGKMDAVVRWWKADDSFEDYVVEHKTATGDVSAGSTYRLRLVGDSQVSIYLDGADALGFGGEHGTAGVLYDVLVKPSGPKLATPLESRKYTTAKYKQCPECKRKLTKAEQAKGLALAAPPHPIRVKVDGSDEEIVVNCEPGSNEAGVLDQGAPRRVCTDKGGQLYANMRAEDETPEEYEKRVYDETLSDPDLFLMRQVVGRTADELDRHRQDVFAEASAILLTENMRPGTLLWHAPRNPDGCFQFGRQCEYWPVCYGGQSLDNPSLYTHVEDPHTELSAKDASR